MSGVCAECGRPTEKPWHKWCSFHFSNRGVVHPDDTDLPEQDDRIPKDVLPTERALWAANKQFEFTRPTHHCLMEPIEFEPTGLPCHICGEAHGGLEYEGDLFCPLSLGLQNARLTIREAGEVDPDIVNRFLRRANAIFHNKTVT